MNSPELDPSTGEVLVRLNHILAEHNDRRVVVVGPSCCGKSTLAERLPGAVDMDRVLFPLLSEEEIAYVCQEPWTPQIGEAMIRFANERIRIEPGRPVFGTIVLDADVVVYLNASDELLTERSAKRSSDINSTMGMRRQIEQAVEASGLPVIEVWLG